MIRATQTLWIPLLLARTAGCGADASDNRGAGEAPSRKAHTRKGMLREIRGQRESPTIPQQLSATRHMASDPFIEDKFEGLVQ